MKKINVLTIIKGAMSIILGFLLMLFYIDQYDEIVGCFSYFTPLYDTLLAIMLISMIIFLVLWNIVKSKLVHLLHIISVICVTVMFIGISTKYEEKYEERYREYIKNHLGYYFWSETYNDIYILRLSLEDYLIIQSMTIINKELIENGKKIVLNKISNLTSRRTRFDASDSEIISHVILDKNRSDLAIYFYTQTGHLSRLDFLDVSHSLGFSGFTRNTADVLEIYNSTVSFDARKKHTGIFAFYNYEIYSINNMVNPINEKDIMNEKIIVEMNEDGFLVAMRINVEETLFSGMIFLIHDNNYWIPSESGCYCGRFLRHLESYRYIDDDTIIFEYFFLYPSSFCVSFKRDSSLDSSRMHYRIMFKRDNTVE